MAILGRIACAASSLWKDSFPKWDTALPPSLKWLLSPFNFLDVLQCCIISGLLKDSIDRTSIGVADKKVPPRKNHDAPRPRFCSVRETITISDDESQVQKKAQALMEKDTARSAELQWDAVRGDKHW